MIHMLEGLLEFRQNMIELHLGPNFLLDCPPLSRFQLDSTIDHMALSGSFPDVIEIDSAVEESSNVVDFEVAIIRSIQDVKESITNSYSITKDCLSMSTLLELKIQSVITKCTQKHTKILKFIHVHYNGRVEYNLKVAKGIMGVVVGANGSAGLIVGGNADCRLILGGIVGQGFLVGCIIHLVLDAGITASIICKRSIDVAAAHKPTKQEYSSSHLEDLFRGRIKSDDHDEIVSGISLFMSFEYPVDESEVLQITKYSFSEVSSHGDHCTCELVLANFQPSAIEISLRKQIRVTATCEGTIPIKEQQCTDFDPAVFEKKAKGSVCMPTHGCMHNEPYSFQIPNLVLPVEDFPERELNICDERGDKTSAKSIRLHKPMSNGQKMGNKIVKRTKHTDSANLKSADDWSSPLSTVNAVDHRSSPGQSSEGLDLFTPLSLREGPVGKEEVDSPPKPPGPLISPLQGLSNGFGVQNAKGSTITSSSGYKTASGTQTIASFSVSTHQKTNRHLGPQTEDPSPPGDKVISSVSSEDSGRKVVVSSGPAIAESFLKVDCCLHHVPLAPPSNTSHFSRMVVNHSSSKSHIKIIKHRLSEMSSAKLAVNPRMFLVHLNLHNNIKMTEFTDIPSYIIKRARLELLYKKIEYKHFCDSEDVFNERTIEDILACFPWFDKKGKIILEQKLSLRRRKGWNALKDTVQVVDMVNLSSLASKFGIQLRFPIDPTFDEFEGILDELYMVHRDCGSANMTKSRIIHALFVASSSLVPLKLLDDIILEGWSLQSNIVTIFGVSHYVHLLEKDQNLDTFVDVILDDVIDWEDSDLIKALPTSDRSTSSITHCLAVWLAIRAESSTSPVTWGDFMDVLRKSDLHGRIGSAIAKRQGVELPFGLNSFSDHTESVNRLKNDVPYSVEHVQSPNPHRRHEKEPTRIQAPTDEHAKVDHTSSASYQTGSSKSLVSSNHATTLPLAKEDGIHDQEEATLLSKKLDPGNPKSILAHAKSVYLTGDYNRTREILENFNHHLTVEGQMLRAKLFGLGISHYREKDYPPAVWYLDELERVALDHNAAADVAVSFIYRGEIHLAQGKYQTAYDMFTRARTAYGADHVAHLFGIVILSKTSVIIKAANCQKHLKNISKAKELFHTAVDLAVRSRESVESSSTSLDRKHADTLRALYKDEIAARTSLGNLHQNTSDCSKSLEEYRIALKLQEKVDTNCIAYGWAQGNLGSALVGRGKVKEAIPHLTKAYDVAKKFERDYSAVGRAANNLGTAFQADKQYSQAEDYFQIALGHSVYCKDEVGQARSLGNIGNVKMLQGNLMEALRCYTETLSLGCDDNALITAYQNRAGVYIALAKQLARGNDWDEVSSDVESVQPKEIQSAEIPVQECTEHHPTENRRLQLVAPMGTYTRLPLDDEENILTNKKQSSPMPSFEGGRRIDPIRQHPLTAFDVLDSDDLTVKHRKYYLERAKEDLLQSVELIEKKFDTLKGEDTNSLALSLFEVNAKAFYHLQKVLVLLGDPQEALKVAEQNRGRNLGEILWNKRQRASNMPRPLDLRHIWRVVNRERTPVIVLSYIQQSSTMLIHMVFPRAKSDCFCRGEEGTDFYRQSGGPVYSEDHLFNTSTIFHTPALANDSDDECGSQIPTDNYHFMKVDLPKEDFLNKNYGPFSRDNKEENVSFDQFVMKTLMSYLNQREIELFTPIDYQDDASPLTILFEKIARRFVEVLEHKFPEEREIIVVADQAAHFFPWPLLQDESTKVFLGDRYRVRTYPSLLTMGVINHQKPRTIELPSEESFLVVGNPATPKFQHGGKEVTLGRLPHSETEALQVAHILETTPLLKEMATKPSVLYRLQTAQIIHIATHSSAVHGYLAFASSVPIVNTAKPVDSKEALIFIDEIQKLHINASLVVLSACDSARGQLVNEGVNSVARAFLAAGAQSVLVSLVRVPDKSASIFMSMFYRFLTHNEFTTSEAMQKSSMAIRCIKTLSQHIHWGGFQLIGRNISMKYNKKCHSAEVAKVVGETSPFPRLSVVQELEKAIFRQDRTPPRDVVLVKGMTAHDPAEIVRDFVVKRSKLFPGGVFWYNCSTPELLEASVTSVKETLSHLKTIRKNPPKHPKRIDRKESMDPVPLFVEHYRLIILDSPFCLEECTRAIPDMKDQEVDIVIIDNMEANRNRKLSDFADSVLIRGCATIEVSDIDRYTSIQRMAYRLLCEQDFCPYEEDYEAFETIVEFCQGSSVLVKVFEGLLTSKEKGVLQSIAKDINQVKEIVISYGDTHTSPLQQASLPSSQQGVSLASSLSSFQREVGKKVGRLGKKAKETKLTPAKSGLVESHNGLITADLAKRLSDEDFVLLSEGIEKVPRVMDSFCNFLSLRLSTEAHSLFQSLSYISGYPNVDSERPFVFPESFVNHLSTIVANSTQSFSSSALVEELRRMNLLLLYPQPVLSPPERTADENLLYIPDIIVRITTYDIDEGDIAFILNISSAVLSQPNGILSPVYYTPIQSRINQLMSISQLHCFSVS